MNEATPSDTAPKQDFDLSRLEDAKAFVTGLFPLIRANFEQDGEVLPAFFIFVTLNPNTGEVLAKPEAMLVGDVGAMENDASKDAYATFLKSLVKTTNAVGIVQVLEAWMFRGTPEDVETYRKARARGVQIKDMPGAIEVVNVTFEHCQGKGPYLFTAQITRDSAGKGTLGEFEAAGDPEVQSGLKNQGRFAGYFRDMS